MELFHKMISAALNISEKQINNTLNLLKDGATIPFISRYRKEVTGGLDEVQIENIKNQYDKLCETAKRKETILSTISEQDKLTAELQNVSTILGIPLNWKTFTCRTNPNENQSGSCPAKRPRTTCRNTDAAT